MTPEAFESLTRTQMMEELKRLGLAKGKSKARKAKLADAYRAWHAQNDNAGSAGNGAGAKEHVPKTTTLSPEVIVKTLPPADRIEIEALGEESEEGGADHHEEHVPQTMTLSPDISVKTLPPDEGREVEEIVERIERRENPRVSLEVEIGFHSETNFFVGFSADISEGGIFVATVNLLPRGTHVKLEFTLPNDAEVHVEGTVAWVRERVSFDSDLQQGMGIAFTDLDTRALLAIQEYMELREPLFHED